MNFNARNNNDKAVSQETKWSRFAQDTHNIYITWSQLLECVSTKDSTVGLFSCSLFNNALSASQYSQRGLKTMRREVSVIPFEVLHPQLPDVTEPSI
jgi:hypothetical protein